VELNYIVLLLNYYVGMHARPPPQLNYSLNKPGQYPPRAWTSAIFNFNAQILNTCTGIKHCTS